MNNDRTLSRLRVTVMGLGRSPQGSGISSARYFARRGADVVVTDRAPTATLRDAIARVRRERVTLVIGRHRERDFVDRDLIVQNPAVPNASPFLALARRHGVPIETDVSLFASITNRPIIGITGTRGKSTTAAWVYDMIRRAHRDTLLGGNIRVSPLAEPSRITGRGPAVLELSSWMIESLQRHRFAPSVAVVTNLYPDHLDRYPSYQSYIRSKRTLVLYQRPDHVVVLNRDQADTRTFALNANAQVVWFSRKPLLSGDGVYVDQETIMVRRDKRVRRVAPLHILSLPGMHNVENALAAVAVAIAWRVPLRDIRASLTTFRGLPYRLETIATRRGIRFVNDSTSTMPEATKVAVQSFPGPVVLIAGGNDKGLSYADLGRVIARSSVRHLVLLPGTATSKLFRAVGRHSRITVSRAKTLDHAVREAVSAADRGWTVLFSPGATSFASFANEFERGDAFTAIVRRTARRA